MAQTDLCYNLQIPRFGSDMIRRYRKTLSEPDGIRSLPNVSVREYQDGSDQAAWIRIHREAFGHTEPWTRSRFEREFCSREWWHPQRMLFAVDTRPPEAVGSVTLGEKLIDDTALGVVCWLAVVPGWQRRGVGSLLMSRAESLARRLGYDRLELETLASWTAANRFYDAHGWQRIDPLKR